MTTRLRQRIVEAAADLTTSSGWSAVTMSRLADTVGVSRQTVYNEVGSKAALAEAMVLDELARFLAVVERAFDRHEDDAIAAIRAAVRGVLDLAEGNALLRAIVSASQGADTELLPLLTTQSGSLLSAARQVLGTRLSLALPEADPGYVGVAVDMIVRVVLSHVMQPSGTPAGTADGVAWAARSMLAPRGRQGTMAG